MVKRSPQLLAGGVLLLSISAGELGFSLFFWDPWPNFSVSAAFTISAIILFSFVLLFSGPKLWVRLFEHRLRSVMHNLPYLSLVCLLFLSSLGALLAPTRSALQNTAVLALFLLGFLVGYSSFDSLRLFWLSVVFFGVVMSVLSQVELYLGSDIVHNQQVAQMLLIPQLVSAHMAVNYWSPMRRFRWDWTGIGLSLIPFALFLGIVATGARMPTLVALVILGLSVLRVGVPIGSQVLRFIFSAGIGGVMSVFVVAGSSFLRSRYSEPSESLRLGEPAFGIDLALPNTNGRFDLWGGLLESHVSFSDYVFGQGPGAAVGISGDMSNPHSEYMRFYVDFGVVGLALFVVFLISLIRPGLQFPGSWGTDHLIPAGFALVVGLLALTNSILLYPDFVALGSMLLGAGWSRLQLAHDAVLENG